MKTLNPISSNLLRASVLASTLLPASSLAAPAGCTSNPTDGSITGGAECAQANSQVNNLFGSGGVFTTISNILIFLVGAVAVIMLIWGGLQYVISAGDQKRVESAKNTILYAIIGIVIAILAFAIVSFVATQLTASNGTGTPANP